MLNSHEAFDRATQLAYGTLAGFFILAKLVSVSAQETSINFNRDIRPILSENCFACHGPDAESREAAMRIDQHEYASEPADSGEVPIVPGNPDASELIRRIFSEAESERMPPAETRKVLKPAERDLLRRWVEQGAQFESHWAYTELRRPAAPEAIAGGLQAIDQFIASSLQAVHLDPALPADRITLIRRLSFDLTGLPPTADEVDAFLADSEDGAYGQLVSRLLDSPRFGERMATYWLDLVRYADTVGYHGDQDVSQSPFRDYVIDAFNDNMPYDRFIREQLAGDLLPSATLEQNIASGYNRLNQTTEEGGAQPKEYLEIYFADRVRNVSEVYMGATLGCAQCHDHKYDPYTARDFYSLGAFFADLEEVGKYNARNRPPQIRVPSEEQTKTLAPLESRIAELKSQVEDLQEKLLPTRAAWEAEALLRADSQPDSQPQAKIGPLSKELFAALRVAFDSRTAEQNRLLLEAFWADNLELVALNKTLADVERRYQTLEDMVPKMPVSRSVEPRTTRILARGNWMDDSGEVVQPAIPAFFGKLETDGRRATRLDLANWLCQPRNPLTSRTMVNRLWFLLFGRGISSSVNDLGGQGAFPSHPDLLDWLASEFIDSGWDIKHMLRTIVSSETYRRSSTPSQALLEQDPNNRLFARQGRFRVDAEVVRDSILFTSGLLVEKLGGPSTKPYQPDGYYAQLNFPRRVYQADAGENQFRRGVYTHWQRTFLHPMLKAFDAPSREECTSARSRSSTPLQALTLLNDPSFVEAARVFAARILRQGGESVEGRIDWAYRQTVSRPPAQEISGELQRIYKQHFEHYQNQPQQAKDLISVGQSPRDETLDLAELAAWTSVARVLLNLHETITRY